MNFQRFFIFSYKGMIFLIILIKFIEFYLVYLNKIFIIFFLFHNKLNIFSIAHGRQNNLKEFEL